MCIVYSVGHNYATCACFSVMDMLRFHKFTIGHAWKTEFGNPEKKEDFDYLIK